MEETRINRKFKLDLEVLSPLAINSGEQLSPLSDYFVHNGKLCHVDGARFQALLASDEALLKKYEQKVSETEMDGAQDFLNDIFSSDQLSLIGREPLFDFYGRKTLVLQSVITSNDKPYIPGSSIKGAIKNAVLYYWLTSISQNTLKTFIIRNKEVFKNRKLVAIKRVIENFTKEVEQQAFSIPDKPVLRQPASNLMISDSCAVGKECIAVANVTRRSLNRKVTEWDLHSQEYIKPETSFSFECLISSALNDWESFGKSSFFVKLLQSSNRNLADIFRILNHFHRDAIESQQVFKLSQPKYELKSNEAILHLGGNKGIYRNTVLLAIRKYYDAQGWNFKDEFAPLIAKIKFGSEDFPNSISHVNHQPLGWAKLTDRDVDSYRETNERSYTDEELRSGNPVEGIFKMEGKPSSKVAILVDGNEHIFDVAGTKNFLKTNTLQVDTRCTVYWRNGSLNFNKQ